MKVNSSFNIRQLSGKWYGEWVLMTVMVMTFILTTGQTSAMAFNGKPALHLRVFNYNQEIPEGLLSARSVAFVLVENENNGRTVWKDLCVEIHEMMVRTGTDVIGYYHIHDVFAGPETQRHFTEDFLKREVRNILIIEQRQGAISLKITKFNEKANFMDHGQSAWKSESHELSELLGVYRRATGSSGQKKSNFLITDYPEFFEDARIIKKQRFEAFNQDLKLDKLAVPVFSDLILPSGSEAGSGADPIIQQIIGYQRQWKVDSLELTTMMEDYPFAYGIVSAEIDEEKLRVQGYQFILYYLHTSGQVIREMLNYDSGSNVTAGVGIKSTRDKGRLFDAGSHQLLYKYYIKHIFSGEIYLGDTWDAEENWQKALRNHIDGIKAKIKH